MAPIAFILGALMSFANGLLAPALVLVVARFIDHAMALAGGAGDIRNVIWNILLIGLIYILQKTQETLNAIILNKIENTMTRHVEPAILEKCANLRYQYIENHDKWDVILRVKEGKGFWQGFSILLSAMQLLLQIIGVFTIVAMQVWWLVFAVLIALLPVVLISFRSGKALYEMEKKVSVLTRIMKYLAEIQMSREVASERILFGSSAFLNQKFLAAHKTRTNANTKTIISGTIRNQSSGFFLILYVIFVMLILLNSLRDGNMTSGVYISLVGGLATVLPGFATQISNFFQDLSRVNEYWKDFNQFLHFEEDGTFLEDDSRHFSLAFEELEFKNVSFRYPDTQRYILNNVNFVLKKNGHYALVGVNGAGKTTIIKLILRLYDVDEGEILLNGINIKNYSRQDLYAMCGVVYQDFCRYNITIEQNINFGNKGYNINKPIENAGLSQLMRDLPDGIQTQLGKLDQDGTDISGGEWQKIAIARALFGEPSLYIFDEPTASLSPTSESEIYRNFDQITRESTMILVTHRLGSTKMVEEIMVFDSGALAEKGSHAHLMQSGGIYSQMFESQRKWYNA
jgi:ATP-binding cassette subfamily B protein